MCVTLANEDRAAKMSFKESINTTAILTDWTAIIRQLQTNDSASLPQLLGRQSAAAAAASLYGFFAFVQLIVGNVGCTHTVANKPLLVTKCDVSYYYWAGVSLSDTMLSFLHLPSSAHNQRRTAAAAARSLYSGLLLPN